MPRLVTSLDLIDQVRARATLAATSPNKSNSPADGSGTALAAVRGIQGQVDAGSCPLRQTRSTPLGAPAVNTGYSVQARRVAGSAVGGIDLKVHTEIAALDQARAAARGGPAGATPDSCNAFELAAVAG